jgi:hypothetical protein
MQNHTVTMHRNTDRMSPGFFRFYWIEAVEGVEVERGEIEPHDWHALGFRDYEDHARAVVEGIAGTYGAVAHFDGYGVNHPMFDCHVR